MQHKKEKYFIDIINYVKFCRDKTGISPTIMEISKEIGVSIATVSRYVNQMKSDGVIEFEGHRGIKMKKWNRYIDAGIPIVGQIACGNPILAEEYIEDYVYLPDVMMKNEKYFILKAKGDSMINAGISDGDMVLIKRQDIADEGQIIVALVDNEATLKRFYKEREMIRLHPENEEMEDILVSSCLIQGIAVKVIKDIY